MLATEGSTVPDLEHYLRLTLWLLPIAAVLCAAFSVHSLRSVRRHRATDAPHLAVANERNAMTTALLATFLTACWGAAALLLQ